MFGEKLDNAWNDWIAFERTFQQANLAALAKYPLTEVHHLSPHGLGSMSRGFVDDLMTPYLGLERDQNLRADSYNLVGFQNHLKVGEHFFLCFSPERVNPGDKQFPIYAIPKVVGGVDPEMTDPRLNEDTLQRVARASGGARATARPSCPTMTG